MKDYFICLWWLLALWFRIQRLGVCCPTVIYLFNFKYRRLNTLESNELLKALKTFGINLSECMLQYMSQSNPIFWWKMPAVLTSSKWEKYWKSSLFFYYSAETVQGLDWHSRRKQNLHTYTIIQKFGDGIVFLRNQYFWLIKNIFAE